MCVFVCFLLLFFFFVVVFFLCVCVCFLFCFFFFLCFFVVVVVFCSLYQSPSVVVFLCLYASLNKCTVFVRFLSLFVPRHVFYYENKPIQIY